MKKTLACLLAILLFAGIMTGCGQATNPVSTGTSTQGDAPPAAEPVKLRVGVLAAMTALPVVDIVNNGLDKQSGIEIELVTFTTGAPMNEAMAAGQLDASCIGAAAVFALANFDAKMISEICNDTIAIDLIARPDSPIVQEKGVNADYPNVYGSAQALKGSTILCPAGTLSQYEVSKYLSVFGLTIDDVNFVPMEYAQAYQAFKTGEGDIVATRSPQSYTAVDEEKWVTLTNLQDLKASATAQIIVSGAAFNEKKEALATLVKLTHETGDKLNGDVDYASQLMADWFQKNGQSIDLAVAKRQLETKPFYGTAQVKEREFGKDFADTLVDFMISSEQLEEAMRDKVLGNIKPDMVAAAGLQ